MKKIIVLMTHIERNPLVSMDFVILISLFFSHLGLTLQRPARLRCWQRLDTSPLVEEV